jgi:hypothetical protein
MKTSNGILVLMLSLGFVEIGHAQNGLPPMPVETVPVQPQQSPPAGNGATSPAPSTKGVEVLARGPVHESFAAPATDPVPSKLVDKQPPKALEEMPPEEKPEGNVNWIPGYWAYDDERKDYLWVSGTWRVPPPGKHWIAGYWKEEGNQWRWVAGFWTTADTQSNGTHNITYMAAPPAPPATAAPGDPPSQDSFYVPGHWAWRNAGYAVVNGAQVYHDAGYTWVAGYWARMQPGYVWVPAHYRWTPSGYVYIAGYWDLAITNRGFLYAPVYVDTAIVGPTYVYTPAYVVPSTVVIDAFWVRPAYCHYYFGDYYGATYVGFGYTSCAVYYSRGYYDPIWGYAVYEHRAEPRWAAVQVDICVGRAGGRYVCPPRTYVEQVRVGYAGPGLVASARISSYGYRTVPVQPRERMAYAQQGQAYRQVAAQRSTSEVRPAGGVPAQPRTASYNMPNNAARPRPATAPPAGGLYTPSRTPPPPRRPNQPQKP